VVVVSPGNDAGGSGGGGGAPTSTGSGGAPGQMGDALPTVDLGTDQTAVAISAGYGHSCALLTGGRV